jgi:hypothetical protein
VPFQYLSNLGINLLTTKKYKLLEKGLISRLKNGNEYLGAHFELWFLSHLIRNKCSIEIEPRSGTGNKKGDFKVFRGSEILFIELKRLQLSHIRILSSYISDLIFHTVLNDPVVSTTLHTLSFKLYEKLGTKTKEEQNGLINNWPVIATHVKDHIIERIRDKNWGHHIIPGLAEYDISPREENSIGGPFIGSPLSSEPEVDRIFYNAVERALKQLPIGEPGILIIEPSFPLNLTMLQQVALQRFEENQQKYQHLSAMVLVNIFYSEKRIQHQFTVVINPYATHDVSNYTIMKDILSLDIWQNLA